MKPLELVLTGVLFLPLIYTIHFFFQATSYLKVKVNKREKDLDYLRVGFDFRTFEVNGLIFYTALPKSGYLKIFLQESRVKVTLLNSKDLIKVRCTAV